MQFTPRVCGGIVEGLPRMIIELNRGTPAPVRLSIPSNRAAQKRDYNEIDPSPGTESSNPPRSTGESVANLTADDLMLNTTGPGSSRDMERSGLRAQLRPNFSGSAITVAQPNSMARFALGAYSDPEQIGGVYQRTGTCHLASDEMSS